MNPTVYMLTGLTGSGKTTYAKSRMKDMLRLSIDEMVFERHGKYDVDYPHEKYSKYMNEAKQELDFKLLHALANKQNVILDYGFWSKEERDFYKQLIQENGGKWVLYYFKASNSELLARLLKRNERNDANALEVSSSMLKDFIARFEEPVNEHEILITK